MPFATIQEANYNLSRVDLCHHLHLPQKQAEAGGWHCSKPCTNMQDVQTVDRIRLLQHSLDPDRLFPANLEARSQPCILFPSNAGTFEGISQIDARVRVQQSGSCLTFRHQPERDWLRQSEAFPPETTDIAAQIFVFHRTTARLSYATADGPWQRHDASDCAYTPSQNYRVK
ncbi:hypothetical protein BDW74DRAFT_150360 [Aspergillus multicolor]|uniref:uncharacterized protein n=1 Tax=Aspergillus multicolor TaxID=41759 RepID=UPI003CCD9732